MNLAEKYRPRVLADVIGHDKAKKSIALIESRGGFGGRACWISGPSGTGKTTLARIIARTLADDMNVVECDGGDVTAAWLADFERTSRFYGMGQRSGRAWIINEAHGLRAPVIRALLVLLESLPGHVTVIFTTTLDGQDKLFEDAIDAHPLLSRCVVLSLSSQGLCRPAAARLREIAGAEGLDGQPVERYERLMKDQGNNLRACLSAIDAGAMLA